MKQTYRIFLVAIIGVVALVIGSLVVRQAGMISHEEPLRPTPFPTSQINLTLTVTIKPDISLLSQGIGGALQETALAAEGTPTASPTLCPPSDVVCPGGNATMSAADKVMVLMASASAPEFGQLAQTATALAIRPTPTPTSASPQCIWTWARQDLPDVTEAAQAALTSAGMNNVSIHSEAYGENCVDGRNNKVAHFAAMTTDFYLDAKVSRLDDVDGLRQVVTDSYQVLNKLNIKLPAQLGYLDITFTVGSQTKHFRAMFSTIRPYLEGAKDIKNLLAAGGM